MFFSLGFFGNPRQHIFEGRPKIEHDSFTVTTAAGDRMKWNPNPRPSVWRNPSLPCFFFTPFLFPSSSSSSSFLRLGTDPENLYVPCMQHDLFFMNFLSNLSSYESRLLASRALPICSFLFFKGPVSQTLTPGPGSCAAPSAPRT